MFHKKLIGFLAICALTASGCNNGPEPEGLVLFYNCGIKDTPEPKSIGLRTIARLKTSEKARSYNFADMKFSNRELYKISGPYEKPYSELNGSHVYDVPIDSDFEYEGDVLVIRVSRHEDYPACVIRFEDSSQVGDVECEFIKEDIGFLSKNFKINCIRFNKMRGLRDEDFE